MQDRRYRYLFFLFLVEYYAGIIRIIDLLYPGCFYFQPVPALFSMPLYDFFHKFLIIHFSLLYFYAALVVFVFDRAFMTLS